MQDKRVSYFFRGRIPEGGLVFLEGDPGTGKSTICLDLAAKLSTTDGSTTRPEPNPIQGSINTLYLTSENAADTGLAPRFAAAGGVLSRLLTVPRGWLRRGEWRLPQMIKTLRHYIPENNIRFLILDPWVSLLSTDLSPYSEPDVREALEPLTELADEFSLGVICIRHPTKARGSKAIYRGSGSLGISAMARIILWCEEDRKQKGQYVLSCTKTNLGPKPVSLAYKLVAIRETVRVEWLGEIDQDSEDPISMAEIAARVNLFEQAKSLIKAALADGEKPSYDVMAEARAAGISDTTLHNAKAALEVKSERREATSEGYYWAWVPPAKWPEEEKRSL